jgi:hypothetical protein
MRYQQLIYIQNENSAVRNSDILNVNMSSDICIFENPLFSVSGATKIDCTGSTGTTYVVTTATTIPLTFNFTGNVDTFTATSATFKYQIYKYNTIANIFSQPALYRSDTFVYSAFSGTNTITESVPISSLNLDGDYLIKGYYQFSACTDFLGRLGKTIDTLSFITGSEYGLYNSDLDYYFIAFKGADIPNLLQNGSNSPAANQLFQQIILPSSGQKEFIIDRNYAGAFIVTLNGLTLASNVDYTFTANTITLSADTVLGDIITVIYTTTGGNNLAGDVFQINSPIVSGVTDAQGSENIYYNSSTSKYEVYTTVSPADGGSIIFMLNGATLANGVDYYQSISNPKRIILEGYLMVGDVVTVVYFPSISAVNGLIVNIPTISWSINTTPQTPLGVFTLEVSTGTSFTSLYSSSSQPYVVNKTLYTDTFVASGTVGTKLYYRVKNEKNYQTLCGQIITDVVYSDIIPVVIQTNAINSY